MKGAICCREFSRQHIAPSISTTAAEHIFRNIQQLLAIRTRGSSPTFVQAPQGSLLNLCFQLPPTPYCFLFSDSKHSDVPLPCTYPSGARLVFLKLSNKSQQQVQNVDLSNAGVLFSRRVIIAWHLLCFNQGMQYCVCGGLPCIGFQQQRLRTTVGVNYCCSEDHCETWIIVVLLLLIIRTWYLYSSPPGEYIISRSAAICGLCVLFMIRAPKYPLTSISVCTLLQIQTQRQDCLWLSLKQLEGLNTAVSLCVVTGVWLTDETCSWILVDMTK